VASSFFCPGKYRMRKPAAEVAAAPPEDVLLLREIRDSLKR
jgi:large-conductance mechanosensitive channel